MLLKKMKESTKESTRLGRVKSRIFSIVLVCTLVLFQLIPAAAYADTEDEAEENTEDTEAVSKASGNKSDVTTVVLGEMVARWTFDSNYTESINNMKTELGAKEMKYIDGIHGKAAVFNGKDNYLYVNDTILNLGNGIDEDNNNITISAWVNLGDSENKEKCLLDKGENTYWEKNDDKYWTDPYKIEFYGCEPIVDLSNVYEEATGFQTEGSSTTRGKYVEGNEWFLLTVTYDGKRVKTYHNNVLLAQSNYTAGLTFNEDGLYIGVDGKLRDFFKGAVDDLRIYTKTLSYDEVVSLYNEGVKANKELVEPTKQLVAYYAFDDNLKDASTYMNDAEKVASTGMLKYVIGKNGKAITMSKGSYIRVPAADQLNLEDEFTVSLWLKLAGECNSPILCRQNPSYSEDNDNYWTYKMTIDNWNNGDSTYVSMRTLAYTPDDWAPVDGPGLSSEFTYEDNKLKGTNWIHYAYTYNEGQLKCYINGKLQNKSDKSDVINIANASGDLLIGYDGDAFLNGEIDELKIYTSCASADDIKDEANRVDSISLKKSIGSVAKGSSITVTGVMLKDGDTGEDSELSASKLTYKSSNNKVFTVSKEGKITGVKAGKANLIISYGPHTITSTVVVK